MGFLGVVLNQYPGLEAQDEFEEDDPILVRVKGQLEQNATKGSNKTRKGDPAICQFNRLR